MGLTKQKTGLLALTGAFVVALVVGVGGCVASVQRRPVEASMGSAGSAWEAVLPGPYVSQTLGSYDARQYPEYSRNDAALSPRPPQARMATSQWPEDPRPSLARARRLQLPTHADQVLYFESERPGDAWHDRSAGWNWWW